MEFINLFEAYRQLCTDFADHTLFANGNITYRETWDLVRGRGAFFISKGYKKGDVIAILAANSPDWCITFMAITAIGAIALPMDVNLPREQHISMLKAVKAKAICVSEEFKDRKGFVPVHLIAPGKSLADISLFKGAKVPDNYTASLLFTSGTTGTPKIVTLTHRNFIRTAIAIDEFETHYEETQLVILPLFHVYAFVATFLAPLFSNSTMVFQTSLKGPDIMKSLQEYPITVFPAAPIMWELFFDAIVNKVKSESMAKYRFFMFMANNAPLLKAVGLGFPVRKVFAPVHDVFGHKHKFFISGGAPMKREYFRWFKNMGFNIMEGYGLTETTGPIAIPFYQEGKAGWVGPPVRGNEVKIADMNEDGIGEICFRGDSVSPGYYKNPAATKAAYDSEGFFHTGDLGRLDKNGHISITGRLKNVIVLDSGKNVYPEELEFYYRDSQLISEIAVIGRRIDGRETLYAVIVPSKRVDDIYRQIRGDMSRLNSGLPEYKRVKNFALSFDPLPRNSTRKLLYRDVISMLDGGFYQTHEEDSAVLRSVLAGRDPSEERIIELLKKRFKTKELFVSATMADFSIDSLGFIDLCVYLEENLSISIDVDQMKKRETLGDMVQYLAGCEKTQGSSIDERITASPIEKKAYPFFNPLHHVVLGFLHFVSRRCWKLHVENAELLDLDNTIIIGNHTSYLDVIWIGVNIPPGKRNNVYAAGKGELGFLRYVFPMIPMLSIEENNTFKSLKINADILRQNKSLIIFPEGGRSADGTLQTMKNGTAYLAKKLNKKIVPVRIDGAFEIWPKGRLFPRIFTSHRAKLIVKPALNPENYKSVDDLNKAIAKSLETR